MWLHIVQFAPSERLHPSQHSLAALSGGEETVPVSSPHVLRGFFGAVVRALLFDVLLEQRRQVGRVVLQQGGRAGRQHRQPADQLALDHGHGRELGVAHHALRAQQRVVYTGSCQVRNTVTSGLCRSNGLNSL